MNNVHINFKDLICLPAMEGDAGYDIFAVDDPKIIGDSPIKNFYKSVDYIEYDTGLIIAPPEGYHCNVFPRSSISKTNLILANHVAVIDNGYRGTIKLRFKYFFQPKDIIIHEKDLLGEIDFSKIYRKGDKIGQLVFTKSLLPNLTETDSFCETQRNQGGFGSTGK